MNFYLKSKESDHQNVNSAKQTKTINEFLPVQEYNSPGPDI